ncbi:MAG: acyl-CoA dehydratase activase-related protein [Bacillota bacterium]
MGLPGALFHYSFSQFWERFFLALGQSVVQSGPTTGEMLDNGVREAVSEACVPVKVYHGHVRALAGMSDVVFVPRYVSVDRETVFCPKFLGLPDMIRSSMRHVPRLISPRIDMRNGWLALAKACGEIAQDLGMPRLKGVTAWLSAVRSGDTRVSLPGPDSIPLPSSDQGGRLRLAILGYPYAIYDRFVNMDLLRKLARLGVDILTIETLPGRLPPPVSPGKHLFWHYSDRVARAAHHCIERRCVDGLIHVTAFGCGPDALTGKIVDIEASRRGMPFMAILLDEYSGEAGLMTRLEAFVDMVRRAGERRIRFAAPTAG